MGEGEDSSSNSEEEQDEMQTTQINVHDGKWKIICMWMWAEERCRGMGDRSDSGEISRAKFRSRG